MTRADRRAARAAHTNAMLAELESDASFLRPGKPLILPGDVCQLSQLDPGRRFHPYESGWTAVVVHHNLCSTTIVCDDYSPASEPRTFIGGSTLVRAL